MAFGILECDRMELVPGTGLLHDQSDVPDELAGVPPEALKRGKGRFAHVLLAPQPSDSPNDPLNWPTWKKDRILLILGLNAAVVGAFGPMLGPGFVSIAKELDVKVDAMSHATAWILMMIGLCVFICNPLAKAYGKRPVYVMASVLLLVVSIWGSLVESYSSLLACRIIGGIGMAPYEILVTATVSDLYFVHERGTRLAVWSVFLLCGVAGAGFISGYIIEDLGFRYTFGICAILFGILGLGILLFVPETTYVRHQALNGSGSRLETEKSEKEGVQIELVAAPVTWSTTLTGNGARDANDPTTKISYWSSLRLLTGRYTDAALWKLFARPFIMLFYPCVLWAFLIYGTTLTWIILFSVVNGVIFVAPPYNFSVGETGLTSLSPFIFTLIGEVICGPLSDYICLRLAKRNHGVYEPEFRLVLMIVAVLLGTVGFFGFGATIHYQTHWSGPVLTYGLASMSLAFASTCVFGYVIDCYPRLAEEAFVAINMRNFLTFGLTYIANSWLAKDGALAMFNVLGSCFLGACSLTIPLWIFGKKIRSWVARNEFLNEFMKDV